MPVELGTTNITAPPSQGGFNFNVRYDGNPQWNAIPYASRMDWLQQENIKDFTRRYKAQIDNQHNINMQDVDSYIDKAVKAEGGSNEAMDAATPEDTVTKEHVIHVKLYYNSKAEEKKNIEKAKSLNVDTNIKPFYHPLDLFPRYEYRNTEVRKQGLINWALGYESVRLSQVHAETARRLKEKADALATLKAEQTRVANTFSAQGSVAIRHPLFTAARGTIAIEGGAAALATAIRSAIVGLAGLVAGAVSSAAVGVIAFLAFPRELANGELPKRYTFSTPLSDLAPDLDLQSLQQAVATTGTVDISIRVSSITAEDGRSKVFAVKTDGITVPSKVRVVAATYNAGQNVYTATTADMPARTLTWTPIASPGNSSTTSPTEQPPLSVYTGATVTPVQGRIDTSPAVAEASWDDYIIVYPIDSGFAPVYVMFNSPYGETNAKGKYSGRDYNTNKAGGPILDLDWRTATVDQAGVDKVKLHTSRFGESPENKVMIERLEMILKGELQITDIDKRFYTHEIRELERYRNLGVKDGMLPENITEVWNSTHTATLEDYKVNEGTQPLYTPEAEEAYFK
ncbi:S-type pyocin domain-containing protein [Pseudomonas piscis]|uniref:S-type pyocin domain-containing protein n=1 Tax=Pseudomonas piscis TaxID=2614538 RepID=UPI0021D60676|nr:S-type pyocin domain-containing protein [Pseudomonas piscis]MCU7649105.1 S-type pyocin domain-containing protein [Pseudomonas piscis]